MVSNYSTVPELEVNKVWSIDSSNKIDFDQLILSFTLTVNVGGLINKHNYKLRQQQLYYLIKNYITINTFLTNELVNYYSKMDIEVSGKIKF